MVWFRYWQSPAGSRVVMSVPSTMICPLSHWSRDPTILRNVDLPQPLSPVMTILFPLGREKSSPLII